MIPQAITKEHLLAALKQIDTNAVPWHRTSTRFDLLYEGKKYPPKYVISLAAKMATGVELAPEKFSGGDETNSFLKQQGFEVKSKDPEGLKDAFEFILSRYPASFTQPFGRTEVWDAFDRVEEGLREISLIGNKLKVSSGKGVGRWAKVPWIAVADPRETETIRKGVYCVYLIREDCSGVYLTLNQGIEADQVQFGAPEARRRLAERAQSIRTVLGGLETAGFKLDNQIDLRTDANRGRWYQAATIAHKLYEKGQFPSDSTITVDLELLVGAYARYVEQKTPTRTWIFQANPKLYNLEKALTKLREHTWLVRQHQNDIHEGDVVYLWIAGKGSGIIARATVNSAPQDAPADSAEEEFTIDPEKFGGIQPRVRLTIDRVLTKPVARDELSNHPILKELSIINFPQATNFSVTPDQARALGELFTRAQQMESPNGMNFDRAESLEGLIENIEMSGFIFEPWQIATYVTALRTKPFIILAGITGTGKSKLPALVERFTGGISQLFPVRPDWTDSSDVLGYVDLQGNFKEGFLLGAALAATEARDKHFVCILDEMNLAKVEQYFAEILSRIEDRHASVYGGYESDPLLPAMANMATSKWKDINLAPNLAIVGTVNMDESSHGFSKKVLDRAFTLELSDVDLKLLGSDELVKTKPSAVEEWPVHAWFPRAINLSSLPATASDKEKLELQRAINSLVDMNKFLVHAQLQVGYRTRDEIGLFVINALETHFSFRTRAGETVDPLDVAIQMKILPRLIGGSAALRRLIIQLLGWSRSGKAMESETEAISFLEDWTKLDRPNSIAGCSFPRTAAKLCLMFERLLSEGYTSFWL
jgi:hypothetical protein